MIKAAVGFIIFMIALTGYVAVKHDLEIKKEAKSAMIDLCANHEYINKVQIDNAIEAFENAKNNVRLLSTDQEEKAQRVVESAKVSIALSEEAVKKAEGLTEKNDSDYLKELRKKYTDEKKQELNKEKKALSEKMRVVLSAY